jgi:hypothetical protein
VKVQKRRCRDRISPNNPAHSGEFGANREIFTKMCVGAHVREGGVGREGNFVLKYFLWERAPEPDRAPD